MLCVHESNKKGAVVQAIQVENIRSVVATKKVLAIVAAQPDGFEAESKFEISSVYEADLWESFIAQFVLETAEKEEAVRYRTVREEEQARTELFTGDEPEPEPEPEPVAEEEDADDAAEEGAVPEGVPAGLTMADATELERQLAEAHKALEYEKTFDELGTSSCGFCCCACWSLHL
jgi:hypothetical protein